MEQDEVIKELRKIRKEIEAECGNDGQKYYEHLLELQRKYTGPLADLSSDVASKSPSYSKNVSKTSLLSSDAR